MDRLPTMRLDPDAEQPRFRSLFFPLASAFERDVRLTGNGFTWNPN
jgi:hypothetical protein